MSDEQDLVLHGLHHATRDQLCHELASRNLATIILYDGVVVAQPGLGQTTTISYLAGPMTHLYGMLTIHGPILRQRIAHALQSSYRDLQPDQLEGT